MIGIGFLCHAKHDNVNMMTRAMAEGFRTAGVDFRLIDTREADCGQKLLELLQLPDALFICTFNNIGLPADADSSLIKLINLRRIAVVSWYLDHPVINAGLFDIPLERHILLQTAPGHIDCLKRWPIHGDKPLHPMPHAIDAVAPFNWTDKTCPLLFVGTVGGLPDETRASWKAQYGAAVAATLDRAVEVYDATDNPWLHTSIQTALGAEAVPWQAFKSYCILLDRYLRDREKIRQARMTFACGGTVIGPDWPDLLNQPAHARIPGAQQADAVLDHIRAARAVMLATPPYYASHERAFYAAASGAVPVLDRNPQMQSWLDGGCISLDMRAPETAQAALSQALEADDLEARARSAHAACAERHLYEYRARDILALIAA